MDYIISYNIYSIEVDGCDIEVIGNYKVEAIGYSIEVVFKVIDSTKDSKSLNSSL